MPKLKTKSSVKRRFRTTATGKIRMNPSGKRHNLRKRTRKMKRQARRATYLAKSDVIILKKHTPYGI
ncbi:MAG: 50S ribosomal protein L35 [Pseudomonadota bacterium]